MRLQLLGFILVSASVCTAQTTVFNSDYHITASDTSFDGQDIVVHGCTLTVDGEHQFQSLRVEYSNEGGRSNLTHSVGASLYLHISTDMTLESSTDMHVWGRGYGPDGPGHGWWSPIAGRTGGAGHGGVGAPSSPPGAGGESYGESRSPISPGSGCRWDIYSPSVRGGGVVRLEIGGVLRVDGWMIADGQPGSVDGFGRSVGGGSGGSIWISCAALSGGGVISASGAGGGTILDGGGGGGRVAIYLPRSCEFTFSTSHVHVDGGTSFNLAGRGTLVWPCVCASDFDGDGEVDLRDLSELLSRFGLNNEEESAIMIGDVDHDGRVGLSDLASLLAVFGTSCTG